MYEEYAALSLSCNNYYVEYKDGDVTRRDLFDIIDIPYIVPLSFLFFSLLETFLLTVLTLQSRNREHTLCSPRTHAYAHAYT